MGTGGGAGFQLQFFSAQPPAHQPVTCPGTSVLSCMRTPRLPTCLTGSTTISNNLSNNNGRFVTLDDGDNTNNKLLLSADTGSVYTAGMPDLAQVRGLSSSHGIG